MMKLRCLIFFLWSIVVVNAQNKKHFSIELNKVYEPAIKGQIYTGTNISIDESFIPKYVFQEKKKRRGEIKDFSFRVIKSKRISKESFTTISITELPKLTNESLRVVKAGSQEYLSFEFNPIYINNKNEIIQVEEIDFSYDLINKKRFSKINKSNVVRNSVLSTGTWYKFAIDKTGVFKIDASFLNSLGINTESLNPKKIRVFGNGGAILPELLSTPRKEDLVENSILVSGEDDGSFDSNDYVLFYGQGPVSWELNSRNGIKHKQNIYSDKAYYFINVDSGIDGKRIQTRANVNVSTTESITTFTDYRVHEKDLINYLRIGKKWFGEDFSINNNQTFSFNFPNLVKTVDVKVEAGFGAQSSSSSDFQVLYNSSLLFKTDLWRSNNSYAFNFGLKFFRTTTDNINLNVVYDNNNPSARANLDYITVVADRFLVANGQQFEFVNFKSKGNGSVLEYSIENDQNIDFIWDVSDISNVKNISDMDSSNFFKFKEVTNGVISKYLIVNKDNTYQPIQIQGNSIVGNQNLHSLKDVQYLIVTSKEFKSEAERLADYHRKNTKISVTNSDSLNVQVIELEKIYNEFGSGSADITAIRDFAKYLYDNGTSEETKLKYLCLFGDASFDYKGIQFPTTNLVPVYLSEKGRSLTSSYNTDDYYGYLDDGDDLKEDGNIDPAGMLDIATGRVPVKNKNEAKGFVDKTLNYYSEKSHGEWKNKITLLGDDGQDRSDQGLIQFLEDSAIITENKNKNLNLLKLYTDAFVEEVTSGGGRYPDVKKKFINAFNTGSLVINYFGHGNVSALGQENFLDISDIRGIKNINNLPLFITVTCDFSKFDDPTIVTGGEELITSLFGGAGSMITTSREIFITTGNIINSALAEYLFDSENKFKTVAEVLKDVKNNVKKIDNNGNLTAFNSDQEAFVFFFGDPAMKLSFPEEGITISKIEKEVTKVNGEVEMNSINELNALSILKISGVVKNSNLESGEFNGTLAVTLYDKPIERKTLLNEGSGTVVEFKSSENVFYKGETTVEKDTFSFNLILPKDISSVPVDAKFSFYASSSNGESIGSNFDYKVGGIDTTVPEDKTPPKIELYIGDESFIDGSVITGVPKLMAKIQDESGINTSLSGIGHNISLVIDEDLANPISLNEFYTTEKNDFRKGIINYELPELDPGLHTITFKVWDTHNNSATKTLTFEIQDDNLDLEITRVLNYPNPFINYTEFWFTHNKIGKELDVKVQVYTVSGKLVKRIQKTIQKANKEERSITWNGKDDYGNRLGKGTYVYRLTVKERISGQTVERIEKLVIL